MKASTGKDCNAGYHKTVPVQVWIDIDEDIAEVVTLLNRQPGVRTWSSCQGTPGQKPAYVMVGWVTDDAFLWLSDRYVLTEISHENQWAYLHPFARLVEARERLHNIL